MQATLKAILDIANTCVIQATKITARTTNNIYSVLYLAMIMHLHREKNEEEF